MLFGVEGLQVTEAQALPDGAVEVWAVTGDPAAAAGPGCGTVPAGRHDTVLARPRDVRRGGDLVAVCWVKHRWKCGAPGCERKTFTERVPQVPPRCRLTRRLRGQAGTEVTDRGITPAEAARHAGISWPVAHEAFAAAADPVPGQAPAPVAYLGIDEHRRGRPRWGWTRTPGSTCCWPAGGTPASSTCPQIRGLLGQAEGRTADDAAYELAQAAPAWRDAVRVVAIGMCSIYASAVRRMLPGARIAVDLFHVVHLAVKMTGDVRRRVVRGKYWRRGRSGDPGYGIKNLLTRNLEHLSPAQFAKVAGALQADAAGQEIAAARIGTEKLRHPLNLPARVTGPVPCERNVRDRLFAFYDWCAGNDDIPELASLARTVSRREDQIVCAVLTGITNATSESLNRLAKLEARPACGFRSPANQRRRVRIACTRGTRRPSRTATAKRTRQVTGRETPPRLSSKSRLSAAPNRRAHKLNYRAELTIAAAVSDIQVSA